MFCCQLLLICTQYSTFQTPLPTVNTAFVGLNEKMLYFYSVIYLNHFKTSSSANKYQNLHSSCATVRIRFQVHFSNCTPDLDITYNECQYLHI